jgi:hypothetical protein
MEITNIEICTVLPGQETAYNKVQKCPHNSALHIYCEKLLGLQYYE